jgi:hypothetical protein
MKKITIQLSAIAALFCCIFLWSVSANAQEEEQGIKLSRFIDPPVVTPGSTVTVNVFIDKSYRGGLARLDEIIPTGFTVSEADDNGAKFSVYDSILKFSWESMPSDPGFTVSYRLHVPATALGNYTLTAQFIYVTPAGAVAAYFKPYTFTVGVPSTQPVASNPPAAVAPPKDTMAKAVAPVVVTQTPPPAVIAPTNPTPAPKTESVPAKTVAATPIKPAKPINLAPVFNKPSPLKAPTTPAPKIAASAPTPATKPVITRTVLDPEKPNGLYYRVQIMASAERLNVDSVIINGVRDKLYIITYNGISRYYIGAFHALQPAIDYKNRIMNSGLKGPFVVAYKDGMKIPIKDALQVVATN